MSGELGKASLDLEANLGPYDRNMAAGRVSAERMESALDAVAKIANVAERELNKVKVDSAQAARSAAVADRIEGSVGRVGHAAAEASRHLERVKLEASNAAETTAAGDVIDHKLNDITDNANQARRALDRVKLRLAGAGGSLGGGGGLTNRPGYGVGPFGAGYGRVGLIGAAVGAGVLTGPAAGPGAVGLLASIPTLAATGAGALGTLALAFAGVGKAIGGDLKAFKALEPAQKTFVLTVRSLDGWLDKLKQTAGSNLFPGLTKGLRAALSPETIGAITNAVTQFARAIGQAGVQWGKYFGSQEFQSIFGPLMAAGAHNLTLLSGALLSLFDAVGVIGRAAIPFTHWLTVAADKGAKLADSWIHAQDASGGLAGALSEAETSLRLVGGLLTSIGNAVLALGQALYPVSKVAVKDLTDGFNALAKMIDRNKEMIREIVGGALAALVSTVQILTPIVGALARALDNVAHNIGGWKVAFEIVIGGYLALQFLKLRGTILSLGGAIQKIAIMLGLIPKAAATAAVATEASMAGVGGSAAAARAEVGLLRASLLTLVGSAIVIPIVLDIIYRKQVSQAISGAATAALNAAGVNTKRGSAPTYDQWKNSKGAARLAIDSWLQANGLTPGELVGAPASTSSAAADAAAKAAHGKGSLPTPFKEPGTATPYLSYLIAKAEGTKSTDDDRSVLGRILSTLRGRLAKASSLDARTALQDSINSYQMQLDSLNQTPFGAQPPFTKNTGTTKSKQPPLLPLDAQHDLALASTNANRASVLGNVGKVAQRYLEKELGNLQAAEKSIRDKWEHSKGKIREQLFAALTRVQNRERTVRKQIANALKKSRLEQLEFAVDQAKLAVENATVGTSAYDKAVSAEAKALRAEIAYLDKRRRNTLLSLSERKKALEQELAAKRTLKALLKPTLANRGQNEAMFLSTFKAIVGAFAPNAFSQPPSNAKTNTLLTEIAGGTQEQNRHLRDIKQQTSSPTSAQLVSSASTVLA